MRLRPRLAHLRAGASALSGVLLLSCLCMATSLPAEEQQDLGHVGASGFTPLPIAVAEFEVRGSRGYEAPLLSTTIAQDLRLSGFFNLPANLEFVRDVQAADVRDNRVHYADWKRLGIFYVVKGKYWVEGGQVIAEIRTYDVNANTVLFGKRYEFGEKKARRLAHRASDDLVERITTFPGIAGTQILFVGEAAGRRGEIAKEVYAMEANGENIRKITDDLNLAATPSWGANGTEIYYTTYKDHNPDLAGVFMDKSYNWFVSRRPGFNLSPSWSQKRMRLALTLTKDGNSEIYLMNREGKDLKRLTHHRAIDGAPSWSPDGSQIAFTSDRTGSPQIYVMDDAGINIRRLTYQGNYHDGAQWSPRGDKIAFASRVDGVFQIFTADPSGNDLTQLTFGDANCEDPSWAPNGWVLAYTSDRTGRKQIHTMFVDGRSIAHLKTTANAHSPDWSPLFR